MADDKDYGYYGKGTAGYAHYKQDFDRSYGHGGGGGGSNGGCLGAILGPILILALFGGAFIIMVFAMYFFFVLIPDVITSAFSGILGGLALPLVSLGL